MHTIAFLILWIMPAVFGWNTEWPPQVLEYQTTDVSYKPLGTLQFTRMADGNYTAKFFPHSKETAKQLKSELQSVALTGLKSAERQTAYRIKSGNLQTSNDPCLFLHSGLAHEIALTIDQERQHILSMTLFPGNIYDLDSNSDDSCKLPIAENATLEVAVRITPHTELPGPDTASYLLKLEDEKKARQHGATQDNRSFLAKYWMYIVPVVIFMVVSNAFSMDQQQPAAE